VRTENLVEILGLRFLSDPSHCWVHMRWEKANAFLSQFSCGLRKSELYLAWLLWQLVLPSDWAEFCFKWISWIQILSTRRHRRQSGLMTEGIPHGWNKRTLGSIGHRNSAIEHFNYMERKAYKIHDQDWVAIWELTMELFQQCFMDCHDSGTCKMPGIAL